MVQASQPDSDSSTHASIIEEMSQMLRRLALHYLKGHRDGPCLHCHAYTLIERAKLLDDCIPWGDVKEVAQDGTRW